MDKIVKQALRKANKEQLIAIIGALHDRNPFLNSMTICDAVNYLNGKSDGYLRGTSPIVDLKKIRDR